MVLMNYIFILIFFSAIILYPQEHKYHEKVKKKETADTLKHSQHSGMEKMEMHALYRHGSGTGWLPDNSPMYGYMLNTDNWNLMFHGSLFLRYNNQDINRNSSRGDTKFDAPNWLMGMARRNIGQSGMLRLTAMISFDFTTIGGSGYPLLFQSGESWKGEPLIDRQHPHDLFSELSVEYTHSLNDNLDIVGYFGYPGEPALGPVAFMHRTSALNNPDAPLGHHWQDATHITFGVGTLGLKINDYKLEGSLFTGREPNEKRYNFDKPRFDSYSVRLLANPFSEFAMQISHAFVKSPESLDPEENVRKTTASVIHNKNLSKENILSTALIWGLNNTIDEHKEHSVILESNLKLHKTNLYGRFEWIQRSSDELGLEDSLPHDEIFDINVLTVGVNYSFFNFSNTDLILGLQGSIFKPEDSLTPFYGNTPLSLEVYIKISPSLMMH